MTRSPDGHRPSTHASVKQASKMHPVDTAAWPIPTLIDHALATHVEWRESRPWTRSPTPTGDRVSRQPV